MSYRKPSGHLALPYSLSWYPLVPGLRNSSGSLGLLEMETHLAPQNKKLVTHWQSTRIPGIRQETTDTHRQCRGSNAKTQ